MSEKRPDIIVFDLDYTLWPFWVDTHVNPPFKLKDGNILDSCGRKIKCYPEVEGLLQTLKEDGYTLAIASRTGEIEGANQLLKLLDFDKYFTYKEIYPGCKVTHFKSFHEQSGVEYTQMMFFDDEHRNIRDLSKLGVTCKLVKDGFCQKDLKEAMDEFIKKKV